MKASPSQLPFVVRAQKLAIELKGVERNVFLSIVADFLTDPRSEPARLSKMLDLLGKGSGNHLERSGSFGDQARIVIQVLPSFLRETKLSSTDLRVVLGWTARLLLIRSGKIAGGGGGPQIKTGSQVIHRAPANERRPTKPARQPSSRPAPIPAAPAAPAPPSWENRIRGIGWGNAGEIVSDLLSTHTGDTRREIAKAILEKMGGRREVKKKKDLPWVPTLLEAAGEQGS
ncbi:MAG: hypothetical protein ACJ76Y_15570 [Thermoanaerobaculia bacterium]